MADGVTIDTSGVLKKLLTGVPIIWACWVSCASLKEPVGF